MVLQSSLMICMSAFMCSAPSDIASLEGMKSYQPKLEETAIDLPKIINPIIMVRLDDQSNAKPILLSCCKNIRSNEDEVEIKEPEAPEVFSTEIKLTPDWWPMRGTFNPIGLKIKLNMPL